MTASARRVAVHEAMAAASISERRACRFTGFARSTTRYQRARDDGELRTRLETLAILKPRWGDRRLHWLLGRDGTVVNRKRVQRVYRDAGLNVRRRRRKRVSVARVPAIAPTQPKERWSMDFMSDTLGDGRSFRIFTLVDDCSRESPGLLVDVSIGAERITAFLDELEELPTDLVCDNGPEFTSQHFDQWAHERGIRLHFIRPGKPIENCFIESFQRKAPRRMPQRELVRKPARCAANHRSVASRVQRRSAAQRPRQSNPGGVCRELPRYCTFTFTF